MIADIASGEVDTADVFFLIATILFVVAALLTVVKTGASAFATTIAYVGLAAVSLALLVL